MERAGGNGNGNGYAVIWDVDGVLIDSAEQHRLAWKQLAEENGFPYTDEAFWAGFGRRNSDVIPLMYGVSGPPERVAALGARKEAIYRELLARSAGPLPGAVELLAGLHTAGYAQALGSSAPPENIALVVRLLGIEAYVGALVSGEEVAHGKPAPDIFVTAAGKLGVAPGRCLVVEDAPAGVTAAHAGGMRALAVRRAGVADAPGLERADALVTTLAEANVALVDRLLGRITTEATEVHGGGEQH
jgi:HAD superfamily hydrolase (TIGR01509 family)